MKRQIRTRMYLPTSFQSGLWIWFDPSCRPWQLLKQHMGEGGHWDIPKFNPHSPNIKLSITLTYFNSNAYILLVSRIFSQKCVKHALISLTLTWPPDSGHWLAGKFTMYFHMKIMVGNWWEGSNQEYGLNCKEVGLELVSKIQKCAFNTHFMEMARTSSLS